jgi:hypothetical protein
MPIDFPNAPSVSDTHTVGSKTWVWDGTTWLDDTNGLALLLSGGTMTGDLVLTGTTVLTDGAVSKGYVDTEVDSFLTQPVNAQTTNYTLAAGDRGDFVTCDGTFNITIPSATFSPGDRVDFVNIGVGVITFVGSGVTINSVGAAVTVDTQWAGATFFFTSSTAGVLMGKLA